MERQLPAQATLEEIQSLLCSEESLRQIGECLSGMLLPGWQPDGLAITRAKYKPGRPLRAYFDAHIVTPGSSRALTVPVAAAWPAQGDGRVSSQALESAQEEIHHRGVNGPFLRLWLENADCGLRLQAWPLDPAFPQLARMADPTHLASHTPFSPEGGWLIHPVRYRPAERHVLRLTPASGDQGGGLFVKLYRTGEDAARAFRVAERVALWMAALPESLTAARPLAVDPADAVIYYPFIPGLPLSGLFSLQGQDLPALLRQAGRAVKSLHVEPGELAADLETGSLESEVKAVERSTRHVRAFLPEAGEQILRSLDQILVLGSRLPAEAPLFTHSDFKADHLLVDGGRMVLIDFDTCALADPASDIGKFLADLEWWFISANLPGLAGIQASFLEGYGPSANRMARARLYHALILLKITARRARLYDARWPDLVSTLVSRAGEILASAAPA